MIIQDPWWAGYIAGLVTALAPTFVVLVLLVLLVVRREIMD